jgi:hypothetical protein
MAFSERSVSILERDSFVVLFLSGHILDYALSAT